MGACGCSDFNAEWKLKGADGLWYAFGRYPGCNYCHTPAGFTVWRMTDRDAADWSVPQLPDLPILQYETNPEGSPSGEVGLVLLDPSHLVKNLREELELDKFDVDTDSATRAMTAAIFDTVEDETWVKA